MVVRSWDEMVRVPEAERHVVQLYRDDEFLHDAVAAWASEALARGGAAVLIGTRHNMERIVERLAQAGLDPEALRTSGRLTLARAEDVLPQIMREGTAPDASAFTRIATRLVRDARAACAPSAQPDVRAWGELVNILWKGGNMAAAQRLEMLWNEVIDAEGFRLLCSYAVDNLSAHTHSGLLRQVCAGHSHLVPEPDADRFERAVSAALVDHFGEEEAGMVRLVFASRRHIPIHMPSAEAVLVALSEAQPELAKRVLASTRAHLARDGAS